MRALAITAGLCGFASAACAQSPAPPPPDPNQIVTDVTHDASGNTIQTMLSGMQISKGPANAVQRVNYCKMTAAPFAMTGGCHLGRVQGSAAGVALSGITIFLPATPADGMTVRVETNVPCSQCVLADSLGNPMTYDFGAAIGPRNIPAMAPYTFLWDFSASNWSLFSMPPDPLAPATAVLLGGVKIGSGVAVQSDGTISVSTAYDPIGAATNEALIARAAEAALGTQITSETTRAQAAETLKAPLASPALTGSPTAPTASAGTNTTQIASTAFVQAALTALGLGNYLTASAAASLYYPLTGNPSAFLTSAALSGYLTATQAAATYLTTTTAAATYLPLTSLASKAFRGQGTTTASGAFTATIFPTCATAPVDISVTAKSGAVGLANSPNGSWSSSTTSTITGQISLPATLAVLGLTVIAPPTGTAVSVMGYCP